MIFTKMGKLLAWFGVLAGTLFLILSANGVQRYMFAEKVWPEAARDAAIFSNLDEYGAIIIAVSVSLGVLCELSSNLRNYIETSRPEGR